MMIHVNGKLVPESEATISVFDHGLLYGDGVFEGIRSYNGRVFLLREHVKRLYQSAQAINLQIPTSQEEMCRAVIETCKANNCLNGYIRLVVTRGVGNLGLNPYQCPKPGVIIIAATIQLYPAEYYEKGLRIITVGTVRNHPEALNPNIKSLNYLNNILAKIEAINSGVQEAIMLNHIGYVCEATGDNLFVVNGKTLITPPAWCGCLVGITRDTVMKLAAANGFTVRESVMTRYDLYNAGEIFLTGTAAELVPVVEIDKRQIGSGVPGPGTRLLTQLFRAYAAQPESGEPIV
jgi:branched-chain amino acid aminotransferase